MLARKNEAFFAMGKACELLRMRQGLECPQRYFSSKKSGKGRPVKHYFDGNDVFTRETPCTSAKDLYKKQTTRVVRVGKVYNHKLIDYDS